MFESIKKEKQEKQRNLNSYEFLVLFYIRNRQSKISFITWAKIQSIWNVQKGVPSRSSCLLSALATLSISKIECLASAERILCLKFLKNWRRIVYKLNAEKNDYDAIVKRERSDIENSNSKVRKFRIQEDIINHSEQMYLVAMSNIHV